MLFCLEGERPWCFIRLPRTANTATAATLAELFPNARRDERHLKHVTARYLRRNLGGDVWDKMFRFAFTRDPREVVVSFYNHTIRAFRRGSLVGFQGLRCTPQWVEEMKRVADYLDVNEYTEAEFLSDRRLPDGGFWRKFCETADGESLGVTALPFAALPGEWESLCRALGVDDPPELPHANLTGTGPDWRNVLAPDIARRLMEKCHRDVAVGGYE